jgi:hypothetical protein
MNQYEFLQALSSVVNQYDWDYLNNRITGVARRGKAKGIVFNPVTAVANSFGFGAYPSTKRGTERAARVLGLTQELANAVYSQSNRGHAQIVRGKMLNTLFW